MICEENLNALEEQAKAVVDSARRLIEMIGIVRRMTELDRQMTTVLKQEEVKEEEVKTEPEDLPSSWTEDWELEADQPDFYLPRERTVTYTSWAVRCPACGGRPSRCPCS